MDSRRSFITHAMEATVMLALLASCAVTAAAPDRKILKGVPKIGYGIHLCPFPGSVCAVMDYLAEPVDYDYLMGVTGAAFRRFWNRDDGGNVDLSYLAPEVYDHAATAIGYELRPIGHKDKDAMAKAVRESIGLGRPLLAFGIIGPPECGIVAGYDFDDDVLVGYSYFQDGNLTGYYEKPDWYKEASWAGDVGFLVLGEKRAVPPRRDILISSLKWAIDLERRPKRKAHPDHITGLAAYDGWAAGLEVDADYPPDKPDVLATRAMVQGDQCVMLVERHSAARFLRVMGKAAPEAAGEMEAAAVLYDEVADLCADAWPATWGMPVGETARKALADPATRRKIATTVRLARQKEEHAVEHLEAALKMMGVAADLPPEKPE